MNSDMKTILNKGVPVSARIDIRNADFVNMVTNKEKVTSIINANFRKFMDFIGTLGPSADINYFLTLSTIIDSQTLERKIIFSPSGYFSTLILTLNLNGILDGKKETEQLAFDQNVSMNKYRESLENRIKELRNVKNLNELKRKFPILFQKYQERLKEYQQYNSLTVKLNSLSRKDKREFINFYNKEQRKTIPGFNLQERLNSAMRFNIDIFVEECADGLTTLINNYGNIMHYINTHPIDFRKMNESDMNRLELYFVYRYLEMAEMVDVEDKQDYLYYVSNFFFEHKDLINSNLSIIVGNTDDMNIKYGNKHQFERIITPASLYERYRKLLVDNPNLRAIDFSHFDFKGMNVNEVENFMAEYLKDLSAQWEFLLPDNRSYEEEIVNKIKKSCKDVSEEERALHQARLLEIFMEKKKLYDSSDPFFRVKGKGTFDGYMGFIYPNGRVVLDKFYNDADNTKLADGDAIYAMDISEFYELSKLSKKEIIRNKLCKRYIHKGDWASRVFKNEIQATTVNNPVVEVRNLIRGGDVIDPEDCLPVSFKR